MHRITASTPGSPNSEAMGPSQVFCQEAQKASWTMVWICLDSVWIQFGWLQSVLGFGCLAYQPLLIYQCSKRGGCARAIKCNQALCRQVSSTLAVYLDRTHLPVLTILEQLQETVLQKCKALGTGKIHMKFCSFSIPLMFATVAALLSSRSSKYSKLKPGFVQVQ